MRRKKTLRTKVPRTHTRGSYAVPGVLQPKERLVPFDRTETLVMDFEVSDSRQSRQQPVKCLETCTEHRNACLCRAKDT